MRRTTVNLFRKGNASSARLDHVRPKDIAHDRRTGVDWVRAKTGGVSTYARPIADDGCWWHLPAGYDYGPVLPVWNDVGDHWLWEPANDMPLNEYRNLLGKANMAFR